MKDCIYTLQGEEIQHVIVRVNPNESIIGDISTMVCMDKNISINHSYHDIFIKIMDSKFQWVHFNNLNNQEATIILSPKNTGKVVEISFDDDSKIFVNRESFMCCQSDLSFKNSDDDWLRSYMQVSGKKCDNWLLLHSKGKAIKKILNKGEKIVVNTSCIMAYSETIIYKSVDLDNRDYGMITGPGTVWMQTTSTKGHKNYLVLDNVVETNGEIRAWMDLAKVFDED